MKTLINYPALDGELSVKRFYTHQIIVAEPESHDLGETGASYQPGSKKNVIYLLLLITAALFCSPSVYSQITDDDDFIGSGRHSKSSADTEKLVNLFDSEIGLRYSNISGFGLSFSEKIFTGYYVTFSGMISYDEHQAWSDMTKSTITEDTKNILYNFGLEFQRDLFIFRNTKVYALLGGYYYVEDNKDQFNSRVTNIFTVGIGVGFKWYMDKHFAGFFHFGYKFDNSNTEDNNQPSLERKTNVGIGAGISYIF